MQQSTLLAAIAAGLSALPAAHASLYTSKSPVLQVDSKSWSSLIEKSNHTAIVEFYAPWCGHCQNLKPAYEKAAKNLAGLAKVAAVNCDDDLNKAWCGSVGVKGFPTLKIVSPGKKPGRPIIEDYQGARTASAISEAVVARIKDHVKKLKEKDVDDFLEGEGPKALLFTEKGTTSALIKSTAIDYLGVIRFAQVRDKETAVVERFGVTKFPSLVLVPGEGKDHVVFEGDISKQSLVEFLRQAGGPNPDAALVKDGDSSSSSSSKTKGTDKSKSKSKGKEDGESASTAATTTTAEVPAPKPTLIEIPLVTKDNFDTIHKDCLSPGKGATTCVFALVPVEQHKLKDDVLHSLGLIKAKAVNHGHPMFPFYHVPADIETSQHIRKTLGLEGEVELVVIAPRRLWWSRHEGDMSSESVEAWIDSVRFGDGKKSKLTKDILIAQAKTEDHDEL